MYLKTYLALAAIWFFHSNCLSNSPEKYLENLSPLQKKLSIKNDTLKKHEVDSIQKIEFGGSNFVSTRFVPRSGVRLGEGFVNQTFLYASYSKFTAWTWINYGLEDEVFHEVDFGMEYRDVLLKNLSKGTLSFMLGVSNFNFPNLKLNNLLLEGSLSYRGRFEMDLISTNVIKSKKVSNGSRLYAEIRKPIKIKMAKRLKGMELIPMISGAYHWDFYGFDEWAHITPGMRYKLHFSKFSISTFVNFQLSAKDVVVEGDDQNFFYGGLGIEF